ncbi:MAG: bifunctional methionine sulfoxide reductase B/A protein [Deltaproteobacteria bacterium]|nr:bifunctional methionine sulfoxide reductase B/A protein [Candidatus Tharpella sp.]
MLSSKKILSIVLFIIINFTTVLTGLSMDKKPLNQLSDAETRVIVNKGTEPAFSGIYNDFFKKGTYYCKRCNAALFHSQDKFQSTCGWPSFDDEIEGAIKQVADADGFRTEILCANCGAHLGHIFTGEQLTDKNIRHCVNSIALTFTPTTDFSSPAKAYFAGGCFWGVEYLFEHKHGVVGAISGYMGGSLENPSYQDVLSGDTDHLEAVEVSYNPNEVSYEELAKFFFEIHNPTQANGQGPDIGDQYLSAIFYKNDTEEKIIRRLIAVLEGKGYKIVTQVLPIKPFWPAEEYHQNYYDRKNKKPYCHIYKQKF